MNWHPQDNLARDEHLAQAIAGRGQPDRSWQAARDACSQLYERYARPLLAFLAARVDRDQLEDIHQEVWKRIWQHAPEGFRGGNFRAWLYQIARNYLIDLGRKLRMEPLQDEHSLPACRQKPPDELLIEQERQTVVSRCREHLDAVAARAAQC